MKKKLYKSGTNQVLAGVCGGLGDYLGVDPTIVRLCWVLFCVLGGSGVLAYIIAALIIPDEPANPEDVY
ncbi:MAG: PspC domain-containing protein [Oscillospiraceae bacterium]|nr:PspC domain-containing protein [Oscillospiraceae bacterium]